MSQSSLSFGSSSLLVCDARGEYRPATAEEVIRAARQVLGRRVRREPPSPLPGLPGTS